MFDSPCCNHKNGNCTLDLKALKTAIKSGSIDPKAWDRYQEAEAKHRKLIADKAPEAAIKASKADYDKALTAYYDARESSTKEGLTVLYTLRAHHRGRLHGTKFRLPGTNEKIAVTKETQEGLLLTPKAQRLLSKFQKKPEVKPQQNVA